MQVGKFLKNIKRAGQNRSAGGKFSGKSINVQIKIKPSRGEFFLKINKRACTSIRYTRVASLSSTGVDNEKVGVDNEKALEPDNRILTSCEN